MDLDKVIEKYVDETAINPKENGGKETKISELTDIIGKVQFMVMIKTQLQKMEPDLTPDEIGDKIEAGEIDLDSVVKDVNDHMNDKDEKEADELGE